MNSLVKLEILEDIDKAKRDIIEKNGGKIILSKVVTAVVAEARKCIHDANSTTSVDERIKILVAGIQEIVVYIETEVEKSNNQLELLSNRVDVLKEVTRKFDKLNVDEKKMEEVKQEAI
jgi:hypothetical protein